MLCACQIFTNDPLGRSSGVAALVVLPHAEGTVGTTGPSWSAAARKCRRALGSDSAAVVSQAAKTIVDRQVFC